MKRLLLVALFSFPSLALAEVARISLLEGVASRTPKDGAAQPLAVGAALELGDSISVKTGNLKLELTDGSVIALAPGSELVLTEAEFEGQERKGFSALLKGGSLWTKVKKAMGGGKFEVATERAVAGVRGTIFRIDADALLKAARGRKGRRASIVRVVEGAVHVRPSATVAKSLKTGAPRAGPRVEVAGPQEVSVDAWEKIFVDLSAGQQVAVGVDLWEQAALDEAAKNDAFAKWLEKNQ